jgi:ribonuclease HII
MKRTPSKPPTARVKNKVPKSPDRREEAAAFALGYRRVAGVDEAGRGALAGPVVAAAVILPEDADFEWLAMVRDSKLLSKHARETILRLMQEARIEIGVGSASAAVIDNVNILNASKRAMKMALQQLTTPPDYVLTDAVRLQRLSVPQKNIIKGDRICLTISCASIVAKVTRDHLMIELDAKYPEYAFDNHKGYGTSEHLRLLRRHGACKIHRFTFGPVRDLARML